MFGKKIATFGAFVALCAATESTQTETPVITEETVQAALEETVEEVVAAATAAKDVAAEVVDEIKDVLVNSETISTITELVNHPEKLMEIVEEASAKFTEMVEELLSESAKQEAAIEDAEEATEAAKETTTASTESSETSTSEVEAEEPTVAQGTDGVRLL